MALYFFFGASFTVWGLVQNPYRSDIKARREEEVTPSTTTTLMCNYGKRRAAAIVVILFSVVLLAVAFYLITGPMMRHLTQKPETTLVVLATRQDPDLAPKEGRFAGSEPCTAAEACLCRGDYRTANYVHRKGRGCLRIAEHRCLIRSTRGFDTLAHCQRQCGSHDTNGRLSARCGTTTSTQPCSWKDRRHSVFWDGRACRHWDTSVCPSSAHPDWASCHERCGVKRHTTTKTTSQGLDDDQL